MVVDSVAALVPRAEIEGEMGDSHVGLQARLMSQALRKIAGALSNTNTTMIFINQLREKIGVMFGSPETTTGEDLLGSVAYCYSDANAEQANAAFDRGVHTVTHLFNAMRPFEHRDPGIAGAALAREDVIVQIINDGVHLAPDTVGLVWHAAAGRVALVTDATAGAGVSDGAYSLGSLEVVVRDGAVRGPNGVLAGSVLTMIDAVHNLHALGVGLAEAVAAATSVPADVLGLPTLGRLGRDLPADLVVLSDNLEIEGVFVGGEAPCRRLRPGSPSLLRPASSGPSSWRRSVSSLARSRACSRTRASSPALPRPSASAASTSSGWSGTARPTTPRPTASMLSGCFPG